MDVKAISLPPRGGGGTGGRAAPGAAVLEGGVDRELGAVERQRAPQGMAAGQRGQSEGESFRVLLRRHRLAAGLTQEDLAERAGLSARAISDLERGRRHTPQRHTLTLLTQALRLTGDDLAAFEASVQRRRRPLEERPQTAEGAEPRAAPSLPLLLPELIGRERELAAVVRLVTRPDVRLVTLTGPGGVGKTRLAHEVVASTTDFYRDGSWVVPLAGLTDPAAVAAAVAEAIGLLGAAGRGVGGRESSPRAGRGLVERLGTTLRDGRRLLVLDNLEHLLPAATLLGQLLAASPGLDVLVTSQTVLRLSFEHVYSLPPLRVPGPVRRPLPEALLQFEAVRLFVLRSCAAWAEFELTPANAPAVAAICRRLDGLPLALELAAARVRTLAPEALDEQLAQNRLTVLTSGLRDADERHQTLRRTLDWSHSLLSAEDQTLFRRLSVFAGGCTLEAAEAVCGDRREPRLGILAGLGALIDQSLLGHGEQPQGEPAPDAPRFVMLETVREYAAEHLQRSPEEATVRRRHAAYYGALAQRIEPQLYGPQEATWFARLAQEQRNFRLALRWAVEEPAPRDGLRLAAALWRFWNVRGHWVEAGEWTEALLALPGAATPSVERAQGLWLRGILAWMRRDVARARPALEESLALARAGGDQAATANALYGLGVVAAARQEPEAAVALTAEAVAIWRDLGDEAQLSRALTSQGILLRDRGDLDEARRLLQEGLALCRARGYAVGAGWALDELGTIAFAGGDLETAAACFKEGAAYRYEVLDGALAVSLRHLAEVAGGHLPLEGRLRASWERRSRSASTSARTTACSRTGTTWPPPTPSRPPRGACWARSASPRSGPRGGRLLCRGPWLWRPAPRPDRRHLHRPPTPRPACAVRLRAQLAWAIRVSVPGGLTRAGADCKRANRAPGWGAASLASRSPGARQGRG